MSTRTTLIIFLILLINMSVGFWIGRTSTPNTLKPYSGPGNSVLAPGTVVKEQYKGPNSISGRLDIGGVWILEEQ